MEQHYNQGTMKLPIGTTIDLNVEDEHATAELIIDVTEPSNSYYFGTAEDVGIDGFDNVQFSLSPEYGSAVMWVAFTYKGIRIAWQGETINELRGLLNDISFNRRYKSKGDAEPSCTEAIGLMHKLYQVAVDNVSWNERIIDVLKDVQRKAIEKGRRIQADKTRRCMNEMFYTSD